MRRRSNATAAETTQQITRVRLAPSFSQDLNIYNDASWENNNKQNSARITETKEEKKTAATKIF